MKLSTLKVNGKELAALAGEGGLVLVESINEAEGTGWSTELFELIRLGELEQLTEWYNGGGREKLRQLMTIPYTEASYGPLYRQPRKIWGIGMNYVKDAAELAMADPNDEPVSFMKPDTSLIGPLDAIRIPPEAGKITAEAELGIIIGKTCKNIKEADVYDVIAGYTTTIDVTAADIHARNPRYLTRAKSFDTFFSFGPQFITKDEFPDPLEIKVETVINGEVAHCNKVFNMKFRPSFAVAFHSQVMTLLPGDIIMTGTPGAVVIRDGDMVECRIDHFEPLLNPVRD
ncbi:fumarylacetoacetate hydrolase family protein [Paenibacillus prosopidis]|uniref:2-keto-4-pentenoate hydratase/2-oxohepta-3-ene-1,7-dioic acid hydratase in catechol pathway n=1 Tax=Paenibacillus prosopidis TaxID=630520 RepID=A0A368VV13_9BACL|nr:fumarylacetoacetate hydrolase family protein [Paenibacillus prosopidis]RCW44978.1 2-keto-4-pentenoate hydratase/2-oxohepta-3-ene-1,7-dioic acid hydratase in catechol pathway [Paenibacillus prosopidis]